jgi:hypothetical protein
MIFYAFALAYPVWQTVINNQTLCAICPKIVKEE